MSRMTDTLEWRDIRGYEGRYQISSLGNVRAVDRVIVQKSKYGQMMERNIKGALLTPTNNGHGYQIIGLYNGRIRKNHYIHRLVAEAFIRPIRDNEVVNHIDFNTFNNKVSNLEIVTQRENVRHSCLHMKKPKTTCRISNTGEKYIGFKDGKYRVSIAAFKVAKTFKTLEEAIAYRDEVTRNGEKYYAD